MLQDCSVVAVLTGRVRFHLSINVDDLPSKAVKAVRTAPEARIDGAAQV